MNFKYLLINITTCFLFCFCLAKEGQTALITRPGQRWASCHYNDYTPMDCFVAGFVCGPGDLEKNITAVEKAIDELAKSEEFKGATKFQGKVAEIKRLSEAEKFSAYLAVIGIKHDDEAEIKQLVTRREPKPEWITATQKNLDLNADQARALVDKLAAALQDS